MVIRSLVIGPLGWWPQDFIRGWLIKRTVRELREAGGGYVLEVRGKSRLEVRIPSRKSGPAAHWCGHVGKSPKERPANRSSHSVQHGRA